MRRTSGGWRNWRRRGLFDAGSMTEFPNFPNLRKEGGGRLARNGVSRGARRRSQMKFGNEGQESSPTETRRVREVGDCDICAGWV